jgi:uncharacterized protein
MRIRLKWEQGELTGTLNDSPTAKKLAQVMPCENAANTWGEEVYFEVLLDTEVEPDARQVVDPGAICYWVQGNAVALPYGPTPISEGNECRLVAEVNVIGQFDGDPRQLSTIQPGAAVRLEAAE